jgi:hypothetical protein
MVRALIERVTVTMPGDVENVVVRIQWIGGTSTEHTLRRPISRYERLTDSPRMRRLVEAAVAVGQNSAQIAECLDREGFRPPSGRADRFNPERASGLVYRLGLSPRCRPAESLSEDEWWIRDLADVLGVGRLRRLRDAFRPGRTSCYPVESTRPRLAPSRSVAAGPRLHAMRSTKGPDSRGPASGAEVSGRWRAGG